MSTGRLAFLVTALLAVILAGCGGGGAVPSGVAAVCDGEEIKVSTVEHLLEQAKRRYKSSGQKFPAQGTQEYRQIRNDALQYLITRCQLLHEADDRGVDVSDKDVQKRMSDLVVSVANGDQKQFEKLVKAQGLTMDEVRDQVRTQLVSQKLQEEVGKDVKVSDEDIEKYYKSNPDAFQQPESREVRHILLGTCTSPAGRSPGCLSTPKARSRADQVHAQLRGGANFGQLAKRVSTEPAAKTTGGKLTVTKVGFDPVFTKNAFALATRAISKPIKTQFGYHIIQALSPVRPARKQPLKQVKDQIRQQLLQQKRSEAAVKFFNDLKKKYEDKVDYAAGYAPPTTTQQTTTSQ